MIGLCPVDLFGFGLVKFCANSIMFLFPSLFVLGFMGIFSLNAGASVPTFCLLCPVDVIPRSAEIPLRKFRNMWHVSEDVAVNLLQVGLPGSRFCE